MIKTNKGNNPCAYVSQIIDQGESGLTIPPEKYDIGIAPSDVRDNGMKLPSKVESYEIIKSPNGDVLRIGKDKKYPPVSKEKKSQYIVKEIDGQVRTFRVGSESPSISKKKDIENFNIKESEDNSR